MKTIHILLIEDDADDCFLMQKLLSGEDSFLLEKLEGAMMSKSERYEVVTTGQLASGIDLLSKRKFDLIILDLTLPDSQGFETLTKIHQFVPNTPIIIMTGLKDDQMAEKSVRHGAQDYLLKGEIDTKTLLRSIRYSLERQKGEDALRLSEERLRHAQKMDALGRLAGGIAHDFNNILSAVLGFSELTLRKLEGNNPIRRYVEEIKKAGERAAVLTRRLLTMTRAQMVQPRILDLNAVVLDMKKMFHRLIGEDIELVTHLDEALWQTKADPGQVEQIILNLVINSRDAMPVGGKLILETQNITIDSSESQPDLTITAGSYVLLSVSDTGAGMTDEIKGHLFEPFFTTKAPGKGTGLGLSTVYGIVSQLGGFINVFSEPGQGSTFRIYFPRFTAGVEKLVETPRDENRPRGRETVLLVEDEDMVRTLVKEILQREGYTVLEAHDGTEAVHLCQQQVGPVHLLVTDVVMPHMSGRELAEKVLLLHPETRVLFMSGYTDNISLQSGILKKETSFIAKPFTPDLLASKVREVLQP